MTISTLGSHLAAASSSAVSAATGANGANFGELLGAAITAVESTQAAAKTATTDLLTGGAGDVHTVALASQRADLALELFQQVRNKFVSAYQEVMKMPM